MRPAYSGVGFGESGFAAARARARMASRDFFDREAPSEPVQPPDYFAPAGIVCPACPRNADCCQAPPRVSDRPVVLAVIADIEAPALARRQAHLDELATYAWESE